jgi:hypothetical protein
VKIVLAVLLVAAALSAAGAARADGWCGESSDAGCQTNMAYVECADGTIWLVDPALADPDEFGEWACGGDYVVLHPDPAPPPDPDGGGGSTAGSGDFGLSPLMAPDPELYSGEVECPDGSIWAVAKGDDFHCPAP